MSYVFVKYEDDTYEYFEDVSTSWGEDGSLLLSSNIDRKDYTWLSLGRIIKVEVSESPHPEIDEEDLDDDDVEETDNA